MKKKIINLLARICRYRHELVLCNIGEGTHEGSLTRLADAAITTRHLLVKIGSDEDHIAVCGASDCPLGSCSDEPSAAERPVNVNLFGCALSTMLVVAAESITAGEEVYTAADGKVQDLPTDAGTYYRVGMALKAASTDDVFEIDPRDPVAYTVSE